MASYQLVGMGTYWLTGENCVEIIKLGLELGYRLIDTAQLYHNHQDIAQGIKQSGIPRDNIFIQSKIHNSNIRKSKIAESIDLIKKELETDYLDLVLLHNPVKNYENAWKELILCQNYFNIRYVGVSNFYEENLKNIIDKTGINPWLNQIELNLFNQQNDLIEFNKNNQIITQSHTTLTKGTLLNNNQLKEFSKQIVKPIDEILFKYVLDQGIGILPRTTQIKKLESNFNLLFNKENIFTNNFINFNQEKIKLFDIKYRIY
jgi:2,5-diketo-D-gluconate reductase A